MGDCSTPQQCVGTCYTLQQAQARVGLLLMTRMHRGSGLIPRLPEYTIPAGSYFKVISETPLSQLFWIMFLQHQYWLVMCTSWFLTTWPAGLYTVLRYIICHTS